MIGSWIDLLVGGLPLVAGVASHGVQVILSIRIGSQRLLSTFRLVAVDLVTPIGAPMMCSSVLASLPSQMPSSHESSNLLTWAPGRLQITASPTATIGFWYFSMCVFSQGGKLVSSLTTHLL